MSSLCDNTLLQSNPTTNTTTTTAGAHSSHPQNTSSCFIPPRFWRAHGRDAIADLGAPTRCSFQTNLCIFVRRLIFSAEGHQLRVPSAIRRRDQGIDSECTKYRTSPRENRPRLRLRPPRDPARSEGRTELAVDAVELSRVSRRLCACSYQWRCTARLGGV